MRIGALQNDWQAAVSQSIMSGAAQHDGASAALDPLPAYLPVTYRVIKAQSRFAQHHCHERDTAAYRQSYDAFNRAMLDLVKGADPEGVWRSLCAEVARRMEGSLDMQSLVGDSSDAEVDEEKEESQGRKKQVGSNVPGKLPCRQTRHLWKQSQLTMPNSRCA